MSDKFTQEDVESGEEIIWTAQPHYASKMGAITTAIFLIPVMGIGLFMLPGIYLNLNYTTYALTDKALYKKTGWLSNKVKRVPLERIQNTEYSRSWIERQFEFGTVEVSSAGGSGTELSFKAVPKPKEIQQKINELADQAEQKRAEAKRSGPKAASQEELAKELKATRENLEEVIRVFE